ncbi:hypothetical protein D910_12235, partial [Dendroctonus ponderosae]
MKNNLTRTQLFRQLFDDDLIELFVQRTNQYACKKNKQIKSFFGILLLSGYVPVASRRIFWENSQDARNELVAATMSRDRFEYIMSNLHCCDNDDLFKGDRFSKVWPLFNKLNKHFQNFDSYCANHSVDDLSNRNLFAMVIMVWMGATSKGYCIWLEPYQGAKTKINGHYKTFDLDPSIILQFADVLSNPEYGSHSLHIFFDNFFTNVPLLHELYNRKNRATGTIRENRTSKCPIKSKREMKRENRGVCDFRSFDNKVIVVKWNDNNSVNVASNNLGVELYQQVSRYSQKEIKRIMVNQPHIIYMYL